MAKVYTTEIHVRGYELDSFGHVNHATYISYMEHARWLCLAAEGITREKLNEWKTWPVIAELKAKYLKPTYIGDTLRIETQTLEKFRTHFVVHQKIFRQDKQVFEGEVKVVLVNEEGRPTQMPQAFDALARE